MHFIKICRRIRSICKSVEIFKNRCQTSTSYVTLSTTFYVSETKRYLIFSTTSILLLTRINHRSHSIYILQSYCMNQSQLEQSLYNRLQIAETNLQKAIRFSNDCFRSFHNISFIVRTTESNYNSQIVTALQDWLHSFLSAIRRNVNQLRVERDQLRHWYCLRLSFSENRGPTGQ